MENDNKLIAEFMNLGDKILSTGNVHSWSDAPFFYITENTKAKVMKGIVKYSKYNISWNWLMPVVEMCYHNGAEEKEVGDITHALLDCNIDATYKAVVNFIKQ